MSFLTLCVLNGLALAEPYDVSTEFETSMYEESSSYEDVNPLAVREVDADVLAMRLLGGVAEQEELLAGTPYSPTSPWPVVWLVGGLCVAGAGWVTRRKILGKIAPVASPLEVVGRTMLHGSNGLVMVNVEAGDGSTRRLLVGIGGESPQLVADLGVCSEAHEASDMPTAYDAVAQTVDIARVDAEVVAKPVYDDLELELDAQPAYVVEHAPTPIEVEPPRQERMDAARAVLNEILAERQRSTQTASKDEVQR